MNEYESARKIIEEIIGILRASEFNSSYFGREWDI